MKQIKKTINEAQLRAIVKEAVKNILNEVSSDFIFNAQTKAAVNLPSEKSVKDIDDCMEAYFKGNGYNSFVRRGNEWMDTRVNNVNVDIYNKWQDVKKFLERKQRQAVDFNEYGEELYRQENPED